MTTMKSSKIPTAALLLTLATSTAAFIIVQYNHIMRPHNESRSGIRIKRKILGKLRMMKSLPREVVKYSQVPREGVFTSTKIPKGLLKEHTTKVGTWGVIKVTKGKLGYTINEPSPTEYILDEKKRGIIEPQVKHEVAALTEDVEFFVEFYRIPGTGPVDEAREGL